MWWANGFFLFVIFSFGAAFPQFGFRPNPQQFPNQFGDGGFGQQFPSQFGGFGPQNSNQFGSGGQQPFPNQFVNGGLQQNPNQIGGGQLNFVAAPTTTAPPPATTPGPEFYRCFDQCPTLSQYSPICASDGMAYHNAQKLQCANQCGRRSNANWQEIVAVRGGSCTPGGRPFVPSPIV